MNTLPSLRFVSLCLAISMNLAWCAVASARNLNTLPAVDLSAIRSAKPLAVFGRDSGLSSTVNEKRASLLSADLRKRGLALGGSVAQIDSDSVFSAAVGDEFVFSAPGRATITYRTEQLVFPVAGGVVWQGRALNDGFPKRAYLSRVDDAVTGFFDGAETQFELLNIDPLLAESDTVRSGNSASVYVIDLQTIGASRAISAINDAIPPPPFELRSPDVQAEILRRRAEDARAERRLQEKAAPTPQSTIDVLIAYTAGMVTRYSTVAGVQSRLNTLIQYANTAYANSEVGITLSLVHSVQVSYPDTGSNGTALDELTGSDGGGPVTIPPSLSAIAGLRNTYGADLVALIRPFARATHASCGIAWVNGYNVTNIGDDAAFGYSVSSDGNDVGGTNFFCPPGTFAHELGHNMGLGHDRANASTVPGATRYAYGYTLPSTNIGDVMSYASTDVQAFSNPSLRCTGSTCTINGGGTAFGVPADGANEACISTAGGCIASQASNCTTNPSSCADASRALNFTRVKVSQFRASAAATPSISGSATISGGGNVANGTAVCANPSAGVTCQAVNSGAFSCTVPSGWTGTLHLQAGNSNRVAAKRFASGITSAQSGQNFVVSAATAFACNLDIDNDGLFTPSTDGVMVLRRMFGVTGTAMTVASSQACAQRTSTTDMANYLAGRTYDFNAAGNAVSASREGLVLLRLMLGLPGNTAVSGTQLTWSNIRTSLNNYCGTSFQP